MPLPLSASAYMRNAFPVLIEGVPASETVIPALWNEKTATPIGAAFDEAGVSCALPTCTCDEVFIVEKRFELRAAIEYVIWLATAPSIFIMKFGAAMPGAPGSKKLSVPLMTSSEGFTRTNWVVHPPPSAK